MLSPILALAFLVSSVLASLIDVEDRGFEERRLATSPRCGQWDTVAIGSTYILYLNQWGISGATGSQCAHPTSFSGTNVAWATTWSWTKGSSGIKSFTNIAATTGLGKQLSSIKSVQTYWTWKQNTDSVMADVTYDLFTSSSAKGSNEYEIMIFLANFNCDPISFTYGFDGEPTAIATVTLAGRQWYLYHGSNGYNVVYSFLPSLGTTYTNFQADLKVFLAYLSTSHYLPSNQHLITAQAGTETTYGSSVTLTTSSYSLVIS